MDAIMALNKKQLEHVMQANERELIELYDENKQLREKIKQLEIDVRHFSIRIKTLEEIKIEGKASSKFWRAMTAVVAAVSAIFGSLFFKKDN
jgi:phage shock protein A